MKEKIIRNVAIVLSCSIIAKILSYVWEVILAAFLGISDQADAFYMTTSIFNILYPILDIGIWKVFLPIYKTKLLAKNEKKSNQIANIAITLFFILSLALVLFVIIFAKPLVAIFAPGFYIEKKALTIDYLRIAAPYLLLATVSSIVGAMLQSREIFLGSQIREIGTHLARIICVLLCFSYFGFYSALLALIVGSVFRLLIQIPFINWKWKYHPDFNFQNEDIISMLKGLPSVAVTAAIAHVNGLLDKAIASGVGGGAVACLNYGYKLMNVFSGTISTAIATAVYPTTIQYIVERKEDKLRELLKKIICALSFFIIPISVFCSFFSENIVRVAFQRGAFDTTATTLTAAVFAGYCLGMLFIGITTVITNVFYGYGAIKTNMYISIVEITVNVLLNLLFVRYWRVVGLALATSISSIICLGIRFFCLKKLVSLDYKGVFTECAKILGISLISCIIPFVLLAKLIHVNGFVKLLTGGLLCGVLYLLAAYILNVETLKFVIGLVRRKIGHY